MIIGISGRIGSGKDTVGKIIQYSVWKSRVERGELPLSVYSFSDFAKETSFGKNQSNFEIKKFAGKLKDMVCMLIGCTREQLEDRDFKEKELGEEWWYYTNTLFNTQDKESVPYLEANKSIQNSTKWYIIKLTPRLLLQLLGTECGRQIIHPNIWVNALMSNYVEDTGYSYQVEPIGGLGMSGEQRMKIKSAPEKFNNGYPNWIITDTRFENELKAIKDRGGISIRVNRPVLKETSYEKAYRETHEHESEKSLDSATFDFVINNDKDIEHLINEVRKILEKLSII